MTARESVDFLTTFEFVVADGAGFGFGLLLVDKAFQLFELFLSQPLADVSDTFLQLQQLFVCHVVGVYVLAQQFVLEAY